MKSPPDSGAPSGAAWVQDGCTIFNHPAPIKLLYISGLRLKGAEGAGFFLFLLWKANTNCHHGTPHPIYLFRCPRTNLLTVLTPGVDPCALTAGESITCHSQDLPYR